MDFERLFDSIGLEPIGKENFFELHTRCTEEDFDAAVAQAFVEYEKGDAEFDEYITAFAEREEISVEVLNLYLYIRLVEKTLEEYRARGIDEEILYATLKDIPEKCLENFNKTGIYGIPQKIYRRWFRRYIGCEIFRLGRLQFQIVNSIYDTEMDNISVSKGDTVLSVHIPAGGRLNEEDCEASYSLAREFFKKHFDMETPVFFCYSWLLQPWLSEVLPEESLIIRFQSKYKIIDFVNDPGDMLLWVFPQSCENIKDYPEDTTLRRATKERLIRGDIIGYGSGMRL